MLRGPLLLLAACLVAAGDDVPPAVAPQGQSAPPVMTFKAGRMAMSMAAERPSEAAQGVWIRYEAVRLECDRLTYRMAALPGAKQPVLASADLSGGPAGPADGRVLFDSSASQLPQAAFRGVLRPRSLSVRRQPAEPERPGLARLRIEASDLGDVDGVLNTPAGARRHVAWADRAVLEVVGDAAPGGLGVAEPRLAALHFYGGGQPVRPATVLRLLPTAPAAPATVEGLLASRGFGMRVSGAVISLYFDEKGGLQSIEGVEESEILDGENLIPLKAASRPVLGK